MDNPKPAQQCMNPAIAFQAQQGQRSNYRLRPPMLTFAVVTAQRGRTVPSHVVAALSDAGCVDVPFDPARHVVWSNERETVWFAGWQDGSSDERAPWSIDGDGDLTAFAGRPSTRPGAFPCNGATWDGLAGVFVAATMRRVGRSNVVPDPLGVGLAYWSEAPDYVVVSSRAALAARLTAKPGSSEPTRNPVGAGWLAYGVHAMGRDTGFAGVSVLPEGAVVDIDAEAGVALRVPPVPPWRTGVDLRRSPDEYLDDVRDEMTAIIDDALASPGEVRAGLTGGKDSRLILALLLGSGRARDVEFVTLGAADLPDVAIASDLAASFGLRHVVNPDVADAVEWRRSFDQAVRDMGYADVESRELALRVTAWVGSGSQNVVEPWLGLPARRDRCLLSGLCGEALRSNYPNTRRFRSKREAVSFPDHMKLGSAGILRKDALVQYRLEMHRILFGQSTDTDTAQDVVDDFYIRNRLRRWAGLAQETDAATRLFPLYSLSGIRLAFAIGADNRRAEWVHHELIRRLCEPLVDRPFAGAGWQPGAGTLVPFGERRERAPRPPRRRSIVPPVVKQGPATRTVNRDRRARFDAIDLDLMRRYLRYDPANPVFEVLDPIGTERALEAFPSLDEGQKRQLYGALTAAIWLGGHEIPLPRQLEVD